MSFQNRSAPNREDAAEKLTQTIARRRAQPIVMEEPAHVAFPMPQSASQTGVAERSDSATGERILLDRSSDSITAKIRGRIQRIFLPDMTLRQRILALPLVGPLAAWLHSIIRIRAIRRDIDQRLLELHMHLERSIVELQARLDRYDAMNMENRLMRLEALDIAYRLNRLDALDIGDRLHAFDAINIANRLNRIEELTETEQQRDRERDNRLAELTRESHRGRENRSSVMSEPVAAVGQQARYDFDADRFYTEFEGYFRGAREDIRERLNIYLPYLPHGGPRDDARVVDIGCGRGEWLELMAMQGIRATGIDLNSAMVDICKELGFEAEYADAVDYLRRQPEGSLAAVTGFHIIEHLSFDQLIALFDAALRALRSDGVIIFETPNPENVSVGSCSFYYDPTHRHPIAPAVAEFIARQRGFAKAEILRSNPLPASRLIAENSEVAHRFNSSFYGPQDYAVIAWKTYAA
jgi:O-antigen chain-terminating methyltransferase